MRRPPGMTPVGSSIEPMLTVTAVGRSGSARLKQRVSSRGFPRNGIRLLVVRGSAVWFWARRVVLGVRRGWERAVKAGRRGSLDSPVVVAGRMDVQARQGLDVVVVPVFDAAGRDAGCLQVPTDCGSQAGRSSAAWSCLRRAPSWGRHGVARAASSAQSHTDDPLWGHADPRALLLAASEASPLPSPREASDLTVARP